MSTSHEGFLQADGLRFDVVVSRFNDIYSERLLAGCLDCLNRHGAAADAIRVVRVPGAFEIPQVARRLARSGWPDAIIGLGVLIRGETPHFDYISAEVTRGLGAIAAENDVVVSFGVLTCDTVDQAAARAGSKSGNKGWDAALAAIETANLCRRLEKSAGDRG